MHTFSFYSYKPLVGSLFTAIALTLPLALNAQHDHDHDEAPHEEHDHSGHDHGSHESKSSADEHDDHDGASHEGHDHDEHGHEEGMVQISSEVREEFGITLGEAGPGELHETVILPGEVQFNVEQVAYVTPRYSGTVTEIRARLADKVEQGQVLATLESTETLRPFEVRAPFSGTIVAYDITPGQTVEAGTPLFTVADLSTVWADLRIYQRDSGKIAEGQSVRIKGPHGQEAYEGEIAYIAPTVDEHTRTGLARVVVENPEGHWKPGQFISGQVAVDAYDVRLRIPRSALITMQDDRVVFVQTDEGFEPRPVEIGRSDPQWLEITQGLQAGETIVTQNPISLKAEMNKASFGGHHGHAH